MKLYADLFNDIEIKAEIQTRAIDNELCPYTHRISPYVDLIDFQDCLIDFFRNFQVCENGMPLLRFLKTDWPFFNDSFVGFDSFLDALLRELGFAFSSGTRVEYSDEIIEFVSSWSHLKSVLLHDRRFLLYERETPMGTDWGASLRAAELPFPQNAEFYRARIYYEARKDDYTLEEMKCPKHEDATEGRANPAGIPVLYLCLEAETTAYEVKALNHDFISVATFRVVSEDGITLLDFSSRPNISLVSSTKSAIQSYLLHKAISHDLSKPMRRDSKPYEYVPTQYLCEYIKHELGVDGIIFNSSVCPDGHSVVVFHPEKLNPVKVTKWRVAKTDICLEPCV
ncbi:MAG: RES family NAD+ phosphorylase [Akkermansia sp.]|nr:RES family NAD+ phosphorylase [Akkermansia sp.]